MRTRARYVSLALAVQLACACSQETAPPPPAEQSPKEPVHSPVEQAEAERLILAFGDSLYAGYNLEQDESFPAVLERELVERGVSAEVVNAGVSGDTTAAGLARLEFTLEGLRRRPDLAIIGLGGNDALRGIDPAETRSNLETILRELQRREIPVLLTAMLAPRNLGSDYSSRFDPIFPELAKLYGAELDPFFLAGVIDRPGRLLEDGIHPNAAGIEAIADRLAGPVARQLKEQERK